MKKIMVKLLLVSGIAGWMLSVSLSVPCPGSMSLGARTAHAAEQKLKAGMVDPKTGKKMLNLKQIQVGLLEQTSGAFQDRFGFSPSFLPSGFCNIGEPSKSGEKYAQLDLNTSSNRRFCGGAGCGR